MAVNYDSKEYLETVDAYWRAANYLSVGTLFLMHNPLLRRELKPSDVKPKPIGHWGTIVPQNFIYAHLNRVIKKYNVNMFYIEGSGHGGQVMVNNSYLDGSYTEIYPEITQDEAGMAKLFKHFSFPGGTASHAAPETPGSLHEGGELGYSLSHGVGAILDNPDQIAAVEIGDGIAVTSSNGSTDNDGFTVKDGEIIKTSNHAGGIMGGISDGSEIILRAHIKPTPSISQPQQTVTKDKEPLSLEIHGRHDPVIVPRAVVVVESMAAITLADALFVNMSSQMDKVRDFYRK